MTVESVAFSVSSVAQRRRDHHGFGDFASTILDIDTRGLLHL
jgi:hypothetical protein